MKLQDFITGHRSVIFVITPILGGDSTLHCLRLGWGVINRYLNSYLTRYCLASSFLEKSKDIPFSLLLIVNPNGLVYRLDRHSSETAACSGDLRNSIKLPQRWASTVVSDRCLLSPLGALCSPMVPLAVA